MSSSCEAPLLLVPIEIWEEIFRPFNIYDLILLRSASRYFYNTCQPFIRQQDKDAYNQDDCLLYFAKSGFSTSLVWARQIGYFWTSRLCAAAAENNQFDTLKMLRDNGCDWDQGTCTNAAAIGNLEMLKWARESGCEWSEDTSEAAAAGGHIHCLKYLLEKKCEWKSSSSSVARIQLDLVKFWVENGCRFSAEEVYRKAAKEGNIDVVKYLHELGQPLPERLLACAVESGNTHLVEWIFFRDQTLTFAVESAKDNLQMVKFLVEVLGASGTCQGAARCGSLEVIRYLHEEKGVEINAVSRNYAVENGHLALVKYIMDRNIPVQHELCLAAAKSGNVDMLKLVHERGQGSGVLPSNIYAAAASARSVACMKYAFENGCPLPAVDTHMICRAAVEHNSLDCLKYAREIGCAWNSGDTYTGLCFIAMAYGHFEVFKYLHENGCSLNQDFCSQAARSGRLEFLKYARHFARWDDSVCVAAAQNIQATCLKYAHDAGLKMTSDVIREAITWSNLDCLKYAVERGCEWPSDAWELAEESESMRVYMYLAVHCPLKQTGKKVKRRPKREPVS